MFLIKAACQALISFAHGIPWPEDLFIGFPISSYTILKRQEKTPKKMSSSINWNSLLKSCLKLTGIVALVIFRVSKGESFDPLPFPASLETNIP